MSASTERKKRRVYKNELSELAGTDAKKLLDELRDLRNAKTRLTMKLMASRRYGTIFLVLSIIFFVAGVIGWVR